MKCGLSALVPGGTEHALMFGQELLMLFRTYDDWKCTAPETFEEPEPERCCCAGLEHGTDCEEFEPETESSLRGEP